MRVKFAARGIGSLAIVGWLSIKVWTYRYGDLTCVQRINEARHGRLFQDAALPFRQPNYRTFAMIIGALIEAVRIYADLVKRGAGLEYLDVGGGLGVDYDGSQTNFESSVNYTLQEYADDVVYHFLTVCNDAGVPHPTIISESGRASGVS